MEKDNLYFAEEARTGIMRGVKKISEAVGCTMGSAGRNSVIECLERPGHYVTNDGFTIANSIKLADPLEEIGRSILIESINRANKLSGDGSSTTCVLTSAILREGEKHLSENTPMEIKKSLERCIPAINKCIKGQKKEVNVENVKDTASISAEDESIGSMIQEIYSKIGKEGIIQWDVSKTPYDSYKIGSGISIDDATYVTSYMCDDNSRIIRMSNPYVLLYKGKISSLLDLNSALEQVYQEGERQILIFCDDVEIQAVFDMLQTRRKQGFNIVCVKMPVIWNDEWWEDVSFAVKGKIMGKTSGRNVASFSTSDLGRVQHATITREETILEGLQDMSKHVLALKVEGSDASLQRAARLCTSTARYFVGAYSESALAYRRLKVEDAINASSCALENGVVVGGGIALLNCAKHLPKNEIGSIILKEALMEPARRIVQNCGKDFSDILPLIGGETGFNSQKGIVMNLMKEGIVDPVDVVLQAVNSSIGVAASVLTLGTVVAIPPQVPMMIPQR